MYAKKRYFVFTLITCIAMFLPFLKINATHFFLLSFDKKELHLFFVRFDMQELYLMPFLFIFLFLFIFFMTTLGGRVWCGWSCPQTMFRVIYRDLIQTKILNIRKSIKNKQTQTQDGFKKWFGVAIWAVISFIVASNFMWYFVPPEDFFNYLANPTEHKTLIGILFFITLWLIFDIVFLAEKFCVYICPYARVQSVMFDNDTMQVIYDESRGGLVYKSGQKLEKTELRENLKECINCEACVKVCPTHIDIRKGMQLDCINCLECSDACSIVMGRLNKPSLISWTSENSILTKQKVKYARFRTIAYFIVLCLAGVALFLMSGKKENMLLNINRSTELYEINENGKVENNYVFLFQNTDKNAHSYYFDINNTRIKILSPVEPISIKAGAKKRVVVTLESENLGLSTQKDTPIKIEINAYAVDENATIRARREAIFVYPKKGD